VTQQNSGFGLVWQAAASTPNPRRLKIKFMALPFGRIAAEFLTFVAACPRTCQATGIASFSKPVFAPDRIADSRSHVGLRI